MKTVLLILAVLPLQSFAVPDPAPAVVLPRADEVTVEIPSGTIIGSVTGVENFNGIPFADAPENKLRLRPPKKLSRHLGTFKAIEKAASCPQMPANSTEVNLPPLPTGSPMSPSTDDQINGQEDCLTVSIQRPKGTQPGDQLPVLFYIFGGGFMFGGPRFNDGEKFINFAESQGRGFVFVGVNYRVGGFGFLGGAEILEDESANLGLLDQRMGLEWVADNIAYFGGDPRKVTIWGQSAGSISVFDQMALYNGNATYKGNSLFRAAIMNSGSVIPTAPINSSKAQAIFDTVAEVANCTGEGVSKVNCLRDLDFKDFYHAANSVPRILDNSSLALSYLPRPDGVILTQSPEVLANKGQYHAVPTIIGDQEDEGTLFSFAQIDVNSTDRLIDYLSHYFFPDTTRGLVEGLVETYPETSGTGSPFRTGLLNEWYQAEYGNGKGFKRMAAILGDFVFTLARRLAIEGMVQTNPEVPVWSYMSSFAYGLLPFYGTAHGSDLAMMFDGIGIPASSARTYYLNFMFNLDPNVGETGYRNWPKWTAQDKELLWINLLFNNVTSDTFRQTSYEFIKENTEDLYF
ncbi:hypothetical protein ED733_005051 [Metarhizium rileyi]|uniref:Carboxylic ester hydrolase n=1 Tax=Metarhizium rileyi (strain RCEF 4871) TaxID=1649241 RepID=A0A5C6G7D2_METRR|nr:hypothetical protein ED733_005051 [Metarhizium rileyi]